MKNKRTLGIWFIFLPGILITAVLMFFTISQFAAEQTQGLGGFAQYLRGGLGIAGILAVLSFFLIPIGVFLASKYSKTFSIGKALKVGWERTLKTFWIWLGAIILYMAVFIGFGVGLGYASEKENFLVLISIITLMIILSVWLGIGLIKMYITAARGQRPTFGMLFSGFPLFFKFIVGGFLYSIIVFFGLLLLIIPGILLSLKLGLFVFFIVDKGMGPIASLKASWRVTKGAKMDLFVFNIVTQFFVLLGQLALYIGLLFAVPMVSIAGAHAYLQLSGSGAAEPEPEPELPEPAGPPATPPAPQAPEQQQ